MSQEARSFRHTEERAHEARDEVNGLNLVCLYQAEARDGNSSNAGRTGAQTANGQPGELDFGCVGELYDRESLGGNERPYFSTHTADFSRLAARYNEIQLRNREAPPQGIGAVFENLNSNRDGQIDWTEWSKKFDAMDGGTAAAAEEGGAQKDGRLTLAELKKGLGDKPATEALFKRLNEDGDDALSAAEWMAGFGAIEKRDGDSTIGMKELERFLSRDPQGNKKDVFKEMDANQDRAVDIGEWLGAHDRADADRNGELTLQEAQEVFGNSPETDRLFKRVDADQNQKVTVEEWVRAFTSTESQRDSDFVIGRDEFGALIDRRPDDDHNPGGDGGTDPGGDGGTDPGGDGGTDPGDGTIQKPSDELVSQAVKQIENHGASDRYIEELKSSMKQMPEAFVKALVDGDTKIVAYGRGPAGLGGTYDTGNNVITMYETAPFSTAGVLACEMAHNWDLNPTVGKHVSSQQWFRDAYNKARASGISQGDNTYSNVYEFVHHMAKYYSGINSRPVLDLMQFLGDDYKKRTADALNS